MSVRLATVGDTIALAELERAASLYPWSLAQVIQSCRHQRQRVLVLETAQPVCGGFAVIDTVAGEGTLLNIAVHPECQGRGFGNTLMEQVLLQARTLRGQRLLLEVRVSNDKAIGLYRKHGFGDDGLRKIFYPVADGREDALLMSLALEKKQ